MAKVVKQEPQYQRRGPAPKYPWDQWFDGQKWQLIPGQDFFITPESLRDQAYKAAREVNKRISCRITTDGAIIIQSLGPRRK